MYAVVCVWRNSIPRLDKSQRIFIRMSDFSTRLREERKRLGLSQDEFAAVGGVKLNAQSNYENGHRAPDADYLARLAAHGVDVAFLFSGTRVQPVAENTTVRVLTPEQEALLDNYEHSDEEGRAAARRLLSALAVSSAVRKAA